MSLKPKKKKTRKNKTSKKKKRTSFPMTIDANHEYGGAKLKKVKGNTALYYDPIYKIYVVYEKGWNLVTEEKNMKDAMLYMDD